MRKISYLFIFVIIQSSNLLCTGSLFVKEDKVCDPLGKNLVVYTGFRFMRQYTFFPPEFSPLEPLRAVSTDDRHDSFFKKLKHKAKQAPLKPGTVRHHLRLTHCTKGHTDYEGYVPMPRNSGFMWAVDICGFRVDKTSVPKRIWRSATGTVAHTANVIWRPWEHARTMWTWVDMLRAKRLANDTTEELETAFNEQRQQEINKDRLTNPQRPSEWCYRAVRRKKYALREVSIYLPNTFVGGLFLCPRIGAAGGSSSSDCTNANAVPVAPLYADPALNSPIFTLETVRDGNPVYNQQKLSAFRRLFQYTPLASRRIVNRVAYFYTKNTVNMGSFVPFYEPTEGTVAVAGGWPSWAWHLDVNEQYTYTSADLSSINGAITLTGNLLQSLFSIGSQWIPWESIDADNLYDSSNETPVDMTPKNVDQAVYDSSTARQRLGLGGALVQDVWQFIEKMKLGKEKVLILLRRLQEPFDALNIVE